MVQLLQPAHMLCIAISRLLLCPAFPGAFGGNENMRGAGHYTIVFPFPVVKFLTPLFPYCVFILLPSSKGAEKLLLVSLLSDAFDKLGFQRGESIRQAGEDNFCIAELLVYMCLSCGMEFNNSQLSCPHAPCETHSQPRSSSLPPFGWNGSLTPGALSPPILRWQEQCLGQDS